MCVLEALSHGIPVLLSNINSHNEIKKHISSGVELFEFDYESFEKSLLNLLPDLKYVNFEHDDMSAQFSSIFTASVMTQKYQEHYYDIESKVDF